MDADAMFVHVRVRCISFCASNFLSHVPKKPLISNPGEADDEIVRLLNIPRNIHDYINQLLQGRGESNVSFNAKENYEDDKTSIILARLIGNIYIGRVTLVGKNVDESITGRHVIGVFTLKSRMKNDELIVNYNDIIEYPGGDINDYMLCATFRSLYESYLFSSNINYSKRLKHITIFADTILQILPFLKLLIKKKYCIIIFLSHENFDKNNIYAHFEKFQINSKAVRERIHLCSVKINIPVYVEQVTNRAGAKIIIVFPNIQFEKNVLKKTILEIGAVNANLICTCELDFINPYECQMLFIKGIKVHFFNMNNYIYYDHFKRVEAFNYVLLSILNKDIAMPVVTVTESSFVKIEDILLSDVKCGTYHLFINKNRDDPFFSIE